MVMVALLTVFIAVLLTAIVVGTVAFVSAVLLAAGMLIVETIRARSRKPPAAEGWDHIADPWYGFGRPSRPGE
jgi:hypothetical protein